MKSEIEEAVCRLFRRSGSELELLPLENPFGNGPICYVSETDSTMELADDLWKQLKKESVLGLRDRKASGGFSPDAAAVRTDYQRSGRGRTAERVWEGERGRNLLATAVLSRRAGLVFRGNSSPVPYLRLSLCIIQYI